ncbi:calcium-binding protein, partial [Pseudomonas mediterranea]|uniref:calcium-binding protein n=1 Tax=Pseudomonas mediterranea TaxID=183795 RepID=UPI000AEEE3EE
MSAEVVAVNDSVHVDLKVAADLLSSGGPTAMYDYLSSEYSYAKLAQGVAEGGSLAGDAALNHMQEIASESGRPLSMEDIKQIRTSMASSYLAVLEGKQKRGDYSDITWSEAWDFHTKTFASYNLPPDTWTLNTPFSVLTDAERADLWQRSLEAAGNPGKEAALAFTLAAAMSDQAGLLSAAFPDENFMRELAEGLTDVRHHSPEQVAAIQHWLAINAASYDNLENFIGALGKWSEDFSRSIKAQINNDLGVLIDSLSKAVNDAEALASPLILDLDGDGVETIGLSANVYFDHDANGFSENTGWVGRDDGLLVFDRNSNGAIDDGSELFGNNSKLSAGDKAANGFSALSALDTNSDGRIDIADTDYASLRVWRDADSDGETDEGELLTLAEADVQSINLSYVVSGITDTSGNQHQQVGTYTRTDGTSSVVEDVWFAADLAQTVEKNKVDVSESIRAMPDIAGAGNVHSLRQAMSLDSSLVLLVQQFELASDPIIRNSLIDQILFTWTGAIQYSANSRGVNIGDGRKLYALEAFLGTSYSQQNWGSSPGPQAAEILLNAYSQLTASINGQLMLQTHLKPLTDLLSITAENGVLKWDVSAVVASFQAQYSIAPDQALQMLQDFGLALRTSKSDSHEAILEAIRQKGNIEGSVLESALASIRWPGIVGSKSDDIIDGADLRDDGLYGLTGNDTLRGFGGDDYINGGAGNDVLDGGSGSNQLFGEAGDDSLRVSSNSRNNLLVGGTGNDNMTGGYYADTYVFNLGDGQDTITDYDGGYVATDTLRFGAGILA